MKNIVFVIFIIFLGLTLQAQDISGRWQGLLTAGNQKIELILDIDRADDSYTCTMDSPSQGAKGIAVDSIEYNGSVLSLEIRALRAGYSGELKEDSTIVGTFTQAGQSFPLTFARLDEVTEIPRPQEPTEPYPYVTEEVEFQNFMDGITLSGTLTLPDNEGSFPAVVLVSGSGPQNRDEELMGHRPLLVLSDHLTKSGIAVLRYDDRGTARSTGDFAAATTYDFVEDATAALTYLRSRKEINTDHIGVIGHSEGGVIATIVASRDDELNFIVSLAGPTLRGDSLLLLQKLRIEREMGVNLITLTRNQQIFRGVYDLILDKDIERETLVNSISRYLESSYGDALPAVQRESLSLQLTQPWMVSYIRLDPVFYLDKLNCPMLFMIGSRDLQVPAKENLAVATRLLENNSNVDFTIANLEGLNHLLQECETGLPSEYQLIEQTISPVALSRVSDWILEMAKK